MDSCVKMNFRAADWTVNGGESAAEARLTARDFACASGFSARQNLSGHALIQNVEGDLQRALP